MAQTTIDFSPICVEGNLKQKQSFSDVYSRKFKLNGIEGYWDVERFEFPLSSSRAEELFKSGKITDAEGLRDLTGSLKSALDKEMAFQKSMAEENRMYAGLINQYLYNAKNSFEGKTVYDFLSYPLDPCEDSLYLKPDSVTFVKLLSFSKAFIALGREFITRGIYDFPVSLENLAVTKEGKLILRHYYTAGSGYTGVSGIGRALFFIASGKRKEYQDENNVLPDGYPTPFVSVIRGLINQSATEDILSQYIKTIEKMEQELRIEILTNFAVNFPKKAEKSGVALGADGKYPIFKIRDYFEELKETQNFEIISDTDNQAKMRKFYKDCMLVKDILDEKDANEIREEATLERQRRALLGYPDEVRFYKARINEIVTENGLTKEWKPAWYPTITEAIYGEILGFSGISNWISGEEYQDSVSCKIIGDRIFYKGKTGYLELQPQKINRERRMLLKRTLLLISPKEPLSKAYHEFYTATEHLRVTIYNDPDIAKDGEDVIILRRYIIKNLTLEEFSNRGSFPKEAEPLISSMVKLGYNVCFTGPVESAKSTLLQAYQALEDPKLEAVSIETDDEIQYQVLMPKSPIIQFVPAEKEEQTVLERVKRSDANYIVIGEARSGKYLKMAVEAANMGTRRMKMTFHNTETIDFAYDVAEKITSDCGGDIVANMIKVAKTFNYIFVMDSLPGNRAQKRLKGIWEMEFNSQDMQIYMTQIAKYVPQIGSSPEHWVWKDYIGKDKREQGLWENPEAFKNFEGTLKLLAGNSPNMGETRFTCPYMDVYLRGGKSQ